MAVARMELRHTRRLLRYWVFISIAFLVGLGSYFYYGTIHALFSSLSGSVGLVGPRYLMGAIGLYYVVTFVIGAVFLAFDLRARDVREGIVEVLDARPLTNLELVAGRFFGLFVAGWVPVVALALIIQAFGLLLPALGVPVGRTVEPLSLLSLVVWMAIPAIAFAIALVFAITLLVRHRLVAALLSLTVLLGVVVAEMTIVTAPYAPLIDYIGLTQYATPSDLVPRLVLPGATWQRFGVLLVALGLLAFAAAIHPRLDRGARGGQAATAGALVLAGFACLVLVMQQRLGIIEETAQWRQAHEARAEEPIADILAITAEVTIEPGRRLDAALELDLTAPPSEPLNRVLLTLNPGFTVEEVRDARGAELAAEHANGLLDIELATPLRAGERTSLSLRYGGRPHTGFGYLDSTIDLERLNLNEAQIGLLGYERAIFDSRYVALLPGIHWLPAAGVDVARDDRRYRAADHFDLALDLELPAGWLAAGPGRRGVVAGDGRPNGSNGNGNGNRSGNGNGSGGERVSYRFAPGVKVPEVAVIASQFERVATEIGGITFELLLHPTHDDNLAALADAREEIEQWVADRLDAAAAEGLEYPFDAFTIVEVPNTLRGFAGGWRLDTALAPPGMMLLRETSFPTARFDFDFFALIGQRPPDPEGGEARVMRDRLVTFFNNDFSGGNLFSGAARSFFSHRTSAAGEGAIALDFVLEELATLLVAGERSYFSAHLFRNVNEAATGAVLNLGNDMSLSDSLMQSRTSSLDIWKTALDAPLAAIDPWEDPQQTVDLLTLKGGGMAEAIYDTLGADAVGELLSTLVARHAGGTFTLDDVIAAGEGVDPGFGLLIEDWIAGTGLPGFIAERAEVYRLEGGDARYQVLVRVANPEPAVGFMRVGWTIQRGGERQLSQPMRVPGESAIEYGVVLSQPPAVLYVHPYLSLNRASFMAGLINTSQVPTRRAEPFNGARRVELRNPDERVYADDLDEGFAIVAEGDEGALRLSTPDEADVPLDNGLPVAVGQGAPREWSRRELEASWGRYRHTTTYVGGGDGNRRAVMPAEIPAPGLWELEFHIPYLQFLPVNGRGTWNLEIVTADGRREAVEFDATIADIGWNLIDAFELPAGEVRVEISNRTDGRMVVADAIAWSPRRVSRPPAAMPAEDAPGAPSRDDAPDATNETSLQ